MYGWEAAFVLKLLHWNYKFPIVVQYRFAFNGMEKDDEVSGDGDDYTAEFWEYDARLGRRWNVDLVHKHELSNYVVLGDNPLLNIDPNGDDWFVNDQGFYIESTRSSLAGWGFDYAGTELPKNVPKYRILVFHDGGVLYHRYVSSPWIRLMNRWFGTKMRSLKPYNHAEESFNSELLSTAIGYGVFKVSGWALSILREAGGSLWEIADPLARGFVYEEAAGGNLVKNYPVIDRFVGGVATSIKTLDLKAKTYQKAGAVFSKLKGYIDKLYDFAGENKGGVNTTNGAMTSKVLDVAIPKGATTEQVQSLQKAINYGQQKGITVKINVIK